MLDVKSLHESSLEAIPPAAANRPSLYLRLTAPLCGLPPYLMPSSSTADASTPSATADIGSTWKIVGFTYFTFVVYLSVGLPLAVLPPYVHFRMGFSATLAGLVISIQYIATLASRPWAGRISDRAGAKVSVCHVP
jgi:hypothetical protein